MKAAYFFGLLFFSVPLVGGAPSLRDVGDIGKVVDSQGVTSVRAKMGRRWTGAKAHLPIKPGDWIRTDVRGANALQVRLLGGSGLILGPGTLVEVTDAKSLNLVRGELEVTPGKGQKVNVQPGEGKAISVERKARVLRRSEGKEIVGLEKEPNWLKGFKGTVVSESMGQLLAKVDGRNTPLTLGYHKVTVDIRDQIARTTIEESFVNHTDSRLEGVFYFPLPQDASISGFGMWINGELVEADVVEKQRAREIYETILRERRDPGLLEWTGGNIFKARVFPIFGHSEKRIKITYTQVLPFRKGSYRYSYALQSEMLRANPLRELAVNVRVHSALPIKKFACTSHDARVSATDHSAQAELTAQEYTPEEDFEVEIEIDQSASPVMMIPHRRGEDGYFLALVTPPDEGAGWEREMVADGDPLDLVILADTSGSMDAAARENQDALLGALLGSLGEDDSFHLATCDSEVRWFQVEKFAGTQEEYVDLARGFVAARTSLGWSDLDKAFAAVMGALGDRGGENTHVIYIGDGMITTGDGDPVAFANRLKQLYGKKSATFHAVAPSSKYEPGVLKTIASLGGGSVRRIAGSDTASAVATKLLAEISAPGIRDMSLTLQGIRTARVYPETLPNLASGKQQIVIGRYLPEGEDQRGEILVKGIRDGKEVEFKAPVFLKDAEKGNSFIPRLWARMHLDALLEQGRTPEVKEDVIALSEEFHIMTPYTSFLVLESDRDRERFKVKRRFQMRDGEKFFAEGRDRANYELLQKQMRVAGTWRLNLQRRYLAELRRLGRIAYPIGRVPVFNREFLGGAKNLRGYSYHGALSPLDPTVYSNSETLGKDVDWNGVSDAPGEGGEGYTWEDDMVATPDDLGEPDPASQPAGEADLDSLDSLDSLEEEIDRIESGDGEYKGKERGEYYSDGGGASMPSPSRANGWAAGQGFRKLTSDAQYMVGYEKRLSEYRPRVRHKHGAITIGSDGYHWIHSMQDIESLFPQIGGQGYVRPDRSGHGWRKEALDVADRLLRVEKLADLPGEGGVDVRVTLTHHDIRLERVSSQWKTRTLIGGTKWLAHSGGDRSEVAVNWWTPEERGVIGKGFQLGRTRKGAAGDRFQFPLGLGDGSVTSIASSYSGYEAKVEKPGKDRVRLTVSPPGTEGRVEIYVIDTARNVLLNHESKAGGKVTARVVYSDFAEAGGVWWAGCAEWRDGEGKLTKEIVVSVEELDAEGFDGAFKGELRGRERVLFLNEPLLNVEEAKQAAADKKRTFECELVLLQHFALSQQWDRAGEHFDRMADLAKGKLGMRWLEMRFLAMKRRNEEVKQAVLAAAKEIAARRGEGEFALAVHLRNEGGRVMSTNEQHGLLELLKPIYGRLPEHTWGLKEWETAWMWSLQNIGRPDEALKIVEELAGRYGWDANLQTQVANMLANSGDREGAVKRLGRLIAQKHWTEAERNGFRNQMVNQLENLARVAEIRDILAEQLKKDPEHTYSWAYQRYLSALIRTDEVDRAYGLIDVWLREAAKAKKGEVLSEAVLARLNAALNILFGGGYGVQRQVIEERFHEPLAAVVRRFAEGESDGHLAERIMGDYRFHQTDKVRELRKFYAGVLLKRADALPFQVARRLVNWAMVHDPAVEKATWLKIVTPMIARWSKEKEIQQRDQWASLIGSILSGRVGHESQADFLRRQLEESPESERPRYAAFLFNHLLAYAWSEEAEAEAFDLLYVVGSGSAVGGTDEKEWEVRETLVRAGYLLALNDWARNSGFAVRYGAVEKKEELSRTELAALSKERREAAWGHLSDRLKGELEKREGLKPGFAHWVTIERIYVDTLLGRNTGEVAAECWEFLGNFDITGEKEGRNWSELLLIGRYLDTLEYLAAKRGADAGLVQRVLGFHDEGIEAQPETEGWKRRKYRLLVAVDRPEALKEALRDWIRPEGADTGWRVALGYLLAELNEIEAAIVEFEAVERADELRPNEYRVLADWYLVRDEKEKRERALAGYYETMPDHQIANVIYQRTAQIRQGFENGVPEDLDPEVVSMMTVLLRKTQSPASYVHQIGELYRYTKDFRLLECIPEGIIGHTSMQVYPFLQNLASVHQHIRDEATADTVFGHLEKVRDRVETKIDARGLDLLEMLVRRKASEVQNQPGQHLVMALAAMKRAFDRGWEDGERKQMAGFLYSLGQISQEVLADEQLREMGVLHREEKADADRMEVGFLRGQLLWQYGRRDEAIEVLEFVLADIEDVHGGVLPTSAQGVLGMYLTYLVQQGHFAKAEKEIFRLLDEDVVKSLRYWLINRKYQLYIQALGEGATVSLGKGEVLYHAAERLMIAEIPKADHELRHGIVASLSGLYWGAHRLGIKGAAEDAREFAYGVFDELVPFETMNYQGLVTSVGRTLQETLGYLEGLRFLVTRIEKEPDLFRASGQSGWQVFGSTLANYRYYAKGGLGDVGSRLLKIVLSELRRDLLEHQGRYNSIYWGPNNSYFWKEKAGEYAKVAEGVLKERIESLQTVVYVASYFHNGLQDFDRAIAVLEDAFKRDQLDENGWATLVSYLENAQRWDKVIRYLVPLVEFRPDNLNFRTRLMRAYFHLGKKKELVAALDAIDERWHEKGWWNEGTLGTVAGACFGTELWKRAVGYFDELIPMYRRARRNQGIGDGSLSHYFTMLASCHQHLGNTPEAVEAAAGAIISWGSNFDNREQALGTLRGVLDGAQDLGDYVALLEKEVDETGLENPTVRKALGQVYLARGKADEAIYHLRLALEVQPNDEQSHRALVKALDTKGDAEGALAQLLKSARLSNRNISLFKELGDRYEGLGRKADAERARTNIVEALPNESEGHAMLAEIRQGQERWEDAITHWGQVAEIRALEPTGLQRLAVAQAKAGKAGEASRSLRKLLAKDWPSRFGNVHGEARRHLAELGQGER